jgi:HPt (histidine-containing phosphotransfer) domain-containing protein
MDAGMNDFIAKPFNVDLMMEKIRHWTGHRSQPVLLENNALTPDQSVQATVESTASKSVDSLPTLPGINMAEGLKIWGDVKDFKTYLLRFIREYHDAGHEILRLLEQGNTDAIAKLAHKLKGASFNVALTQMADLCVRVEEGLDAPKELRQAADNLQVALDQVQHSIDAWIPDHNATLPALIDHQTIHDHWPMIEPLINQLINECTGRG